MRALLRPGSLHLLTVFGTAFGTAMEAAAQDPGVMPLQGGYQFASIGVHLGAFCGPGLPGVAAGSGTLTFQPDGTFAAATSRLDLCAGAPSSLSESGIGAYQVRADSTVVLDWNPANPGVDTDSVFLQADGRAMILIPDYVGDEGEIAVGVKLAGSGMSTAQLNGPYHHLRLSLQSAPDGVTSTTELGLLTFDGAGGYSSLLERRALDLGGATTITPGVARNGTYILGPSGKLRTDGAPGPTGGVTLDLQLLFWTDHSGDTVALNLAVAADLATPADALVGDWSVGSMSFFTGAGPLFPQTMTHRAESAFEPGGTFLGDGFAVLGTPFLFTQVPGLLSGTWAQLPTGDALFDVTSQGTLLEGAVSGPGDYLIARPLASNASGATVGLHTCPARAFGTATAGTTGEPVLDIHGGFAVLGNGNFGYRIADALPGAFGVIGLATRAMPAAVPFEGGALWIDLTTLLGTLPLGIDPLGSGALALPIPPDPSLAGIDLVAQGVVLDPGAPAGLAFTQGVATQTCR